MAEYAEMSMELTIPASASGAEVFMTWLAHMLESGEFGISMGTERTVEDVRTMGDPVATIRLRGETTWAAYLDEILDAMKRKIGNLRGDGLLVEGLCGRVTVAAGEPVSAVIENGAYRMVCRSEAMVQSEVAGMLGGACDDGLEAYLWDANSVETREEREEAVVVACVTAADVRRWYESMVGRPADPEEMDRLCATLRCVEVDAHSWLRDNALLCAEAVHDIRAARRTRGR